jgi:hypothetical protein
MLNRRAALAAPLRRSPPHPALAPAGLAPGPPDPRHRPARDPAAARMWSPASSPRRSATALGQPLVIENRTGGAAGLIGTDLVAKSAPDGYTILVNSSAQAIAPAPGLAHALSRGERTSRASASSASRRMCSWSITNVPARNLQQLLALLRANPGRYNLAAGGIGSAIHLAGEILRASARMSSSRSCSIAAAAPPCSRCWAARPR